METKIKKLPKSEVEIEGEIEAEIFESYFQKALKKLGESLEVDGFRRGKVPENVLLSKIPEIQILEEMAQQALAEHYPKILTEQKIDAISYPEISIIKLARNNPLGFKIKTATLPEIELADYKKISQKVLTDLTEAEKSIEVTEKEIEDTILDIQKSRAHREHPVEHTHKEGEKCEHPEPELPEFNDEFVKSLGNFKDVNDFKEKLKENLKAEKGIQNKEKTRLKIVEKIIDDTKMDLPEVLINMELDKILYQMESDISQMGMKFEDYLKHLNKTMEDLRKDFRLDAEKKAKLGLILAKIAQIEKITLDSEKVKAETEALLERYKEADPARVKTYVENILTNEKIFQLLETVV